MGTSQKRLTRFCTIAFWFVCSSAFAQVTEAPVFKIPSEKKIAEAQSKAAWADKAVLDEWLSARKAKDAKLFWDAHESYQKGKRRKALQDFQKIKPRSFLSKYADYFEALILTQNKKYQEALALIPPVEERALKIDQERYWLRLEILAHLQQGATIRNELGDLSKTELKDRFVQIRKQFVLGLSDLISDDRTESFKHLATIYVQYPGSEFDERLDEVLKEFKIAKDEVLPRSLLTMRAENLIQTGLADWGYLIYQALSEGKNDYIEKKALALFRARRYNEAAKVFESLLEKPQELSRLQVLFRLSQCYGRTDQFEKAIAIQKQMAREYPGSNSAKQAPYKLAFLHYDSGNYKEAITSFEKLLPTLKRGKRRDALWYVFWSHYLLGQNKEAVTAAENALKEVGRNKDRKYALTYFMGRAYEKRKHKTKAKEQYQKLLTLDEHDYYRMLAQQRLKFRKLDSSRLVGEQLFKGVPKLKDPAFLKAFQPKLLNKQDALARAFVFSQMGLDHFAYDEAGTLKDKAGVDLGVALAMQNLGNSRVSFSAGYAAKAGRIAGCGLDCAFYLRFPRAYHRYIEPYSELWGLNPNLAYAIMRQESAFMPSVVSKAYAYGLMQIIPPTGHQIAIHIGDNDFHPQELKDPYLNTLFGTYYLKFLETKFERDLVPTIASYNAGPYNVARWLNKKSHKEWDEFVELIPYSETKKYVKRVLVNYWIYEQLYK